MSEVNTERPWLPADMDETFDPLAHADVEIDTDTPTLTSEHVDGDDLSMPEQIEVLQEQLSAMSEDLAAARKDTSPSEAEIRRIVRDEFENTNE